MPDESPPSPAPAPSPSIRMAGAAHRSFPLVALVQLATFCAALMACIDGAALGKILDQLPDASHVRVAAVIITAMALGGLLGAIVGLGQFRMWRSLVKGFFIGAPGGLAILCVYIAPAPIERAIAAAFVLLLTTIFVRLHAA